MTPNLTEYARAKINLALHVVGRRPDGFHALESLVAFADFGDRLEAQIAASDALEIVGPFAPALARQQENIILKTLGAARVRWPGHFPNGVKLRLEKNLPVASGIGGGSADAAATLRLLCQLASEPISRDDMAAFAFSLGADVPVCFFSKPALMQGAGEALLPLHPFPGCALVLANPGVGVGTAAVFSRLAATDNPPLPRFPENVPDLLALSDWLQATRNDLEAPAKAIAVEIGPLRQALGDQPGCRFARMSGSGGTVFGLFDIRSEAQAAAATLSQKWPKIWVATGRLEDVQA